MKTILYHTLKFAGEMVAKAEPVTAGLENRDLEIIK